jgi:hypothetical protein
MSSDFLLIAVMPKTEKPWREDKCAQDATHIPERRREKGKIAPRQTTARSRTLTRETLLDLTLSQ